MLVCSYAISLYQGPLPSRSTVPRLASAYLIYQTPPSLSTTFWIFFIIFLFVFSYIIYSPFFVLLLLYMEYFLSYAKNPARYFFKLFFRGFSDEKRPAPYSCSLYLLPQHSQSGEKRPLQWKRKFLGYFFAKPQYADERNTRVQSSHFCSQGVLFAHIRCSAFAEQAKKNPREMAEGKATKP